MDIRELLRSAVEQGSSDMHFTVNAPPSMRKDGEMKGVVDTVLTSEDTEQFARDLCREEQHEVFLRDGEIDLAFEIEGVARFRASIYKQNKTTAIACRTIPTEIPSLDKLGMPEVLKTVMHKKQGLILVTGPTGSGKTTTLAAMIDYVNQNMGGHILTLEDPVEFKHAHGKAIVNQREIGEDTSDFASGLRSALRQDPDIILVGEMRDLETIEIAMKAAETGHLVLGTLHTKDAPSTVDRIIDVFPATQQDQIRTQLSGVIAAVVSQRLLKKDGGGRIAALEIMIASSSVRNLIRQEKIHQVKNVLQTSRALGMCTIESSIKDLLRDGHVTKEEANKYLEEDS